MQFADGFIEKPGKNEECADVAERHRSGKDRVRSHRGRGEHAERTEQIHRRAVDSPDPHYDEGRAAQFLACAIETPVFFPFAHEAFDLANAGKVVVQK